MAVAIIKWFNTDLRHCSRSSVNAKLRAGYKAFQIMTYTYAQPNNDNRVAAAQLEAFIIVSNLVNVAAIFTPFLMFLIYF